MISIAKIPIADYNESCLVLGLQRREKKVGNKQGGNQEKSVKFRGRETSKDSKYTANCRLYPPPPAPAYKPSRL